MRKNSKLSTLQLVTMRANAAKARAARKAKREASTEIPLEVIPARHPYKKRAAVAPLNSASVVVITLLETAIRILKGERR